MRCWSARSFGGPEASSRGANATLEDHQKIRGYTCWSEPELPRTEGTRKLKRREIRGLIGGVARSRRPARCGGSWTDCSARGRRAATPQPSTSLDDLGLSSLDRVELLVALEQKLGQPVDESALRRGQNYRRSRGSEGGQPRWPRTEPFDFPGGTATGRAGLRVST